MKFRYDKYRVMLGGLGKGLKSNIKGAFDN